MTPLEALTPYIAVADASFNIEKLSISFGLIKVKGLLTPAGFKSPIGTPSIIINGLLLAFKEAPPLILILGEESGEPPLFVILTPAAFPANNWSTETIAPLLKSLAVTNDTEPVASFFFAAP